MLYYFIIFTFIIIESTMIDFTELNINPYV